MFIILQDSFIISFKHIRNYHQSGSWNNLTIWATTFPPVVLPIVSDLEKRSSKRFYFRSVLHFRLQRNNNFYDSFLFLSRLSSSSVGEACRAAFSLSSLQQRFSIQKWLSSKKHIVVCNSFFLHFSLGVSLPRVTNATAHALMFIMRIYPLSKASVMLTSINKFL